jgi:hypothetical protein
VSNASQRIQQFGLNTPGGLRAQEYWNQSSKLISRMIANAVTTIPLEDLFSPVVFNSNRGKDQQAMQYPALFVYLGLSRFLLLVCLSQLKKDPFMSLGLLECISAYLQEQCECAREEMAGSFVPQNNYLLEENVREEGDFSCAYPKLQKALIDLDRQCEKCSQHRVDEVTVYSNNDLDDRDREFIKKISGSGSEKRAFVFYEKNGDKYVIISESKSSYKKYYIPASNEGEPFFLGCVSEESSSMIKCQHEGRFFEMKSFLEIKFRTVVAAIREGQSEDTCLQKIGEFVFLYINIMPYVGGSAAIGEWLMRGLAQARGIELGSFNPEVLSWDFSAFVALSSEQYGEQFKKFFIKI